MAPHLRISRDLSIADAEIANWEIIVSRIIVHSSAVYLNLFKQRIDQLSTDNSAEIQLQESVEIGFLAQAPVADFSTAYPP